MLALVVLLGSLAVACVSWAAPPGAIAQEKSYDFERWETDIAVQKNGSLLVKETQVLNFTGQFSFLNRELSSKKANFSEGRSYGRVRFKDIRVTNLDGTPAGDVKVTKLGNGNTNIRIGFSAMNEQKGWIIEYRQTGSIVYAEDYDRLYFNVVSIDRTVPIKSSKTTVRLPEGTDMERVKATQYVHENYPIPDVTSSREGDALVWTTGTIPPMAPFTIDVGFPKGVVQVPLTYRAGFGAGVIALAVLLVLLVSAGMIWTWWKKGRDVAAPELDVVRYMPPEDLKPMEVAFLIDEATGPGDITATIVDLAIRGRLVITEHEKGKIRKRKEYGFQLRDATPEGLDRFEKKTMDALFESGHSVTQESLKNKFYTDVPGIYEAVKEQVLSKDLFDGDPTKVKSRYTWIGIALLLPIALVVWSVRWFDPGWLYVFIPSLAIAGLMTIIVGRFMSRRTAKGSEALSYVKGFKEYMATAEAEEMEFMTPANFQANLPYAMVLKVSQKWAEKFKDIYTSPPEWFVSYYPGATFSTVYLASSLTDMQTSVGATLVSTPGGDGGGGGGGFGGGSAGGGFGGGGSSAG